MKAQLLLVMLVAVALLALTGCPKPQTGEVPQPSPPTTTAAAPDAAAAAADTGAPLGSIKVGDKAICAVCAADGKQHDLEEVKATLDYKGKTYAFCSEGEKAEFIRAHTN